MYNIACPLSTEFRKKEKKTRPRKSFPCVSNQVDRHDWKVFAAPLSSPCLFLLYICMSRIKCLTLQIIPKASFPRLLLCSLPQWYRNLESGGRGTVIPSWLEADDKLNRIVLKGVSQWQRKPGGRGLLSKKQSGHSFWRQKTLASFLSLCLGWLFYQRCSEWLLISWFVGRFVCYPCVRSFSSDVW